MNQSLFLFTIGPVQSFIKQARKTQDLYVGSQILSELMAAAIQAIKKEGHNIIFPANDNGSLPNRLIAEIKDVDLQAFGEKIENLVRASWETIAAKALKTDKNAHQNKPLAFDQQIKQHLDIYWLFEQRTNHYAADYNNIERKLGGIKNIRTFEQYSYINGVLGEKGRKCSLDGTRNALFFGKDSNKAFWQSAKWNATSLAVELECDEVKVALNEGLSAASFVKRFYEKGGFPSTAGFALMHNLSKIDSDVNNQFKMVFDKAQFVKLIFEEQCANIQLNKHGWKSFNEQFYYEENLNSTNIPCVQQLEIAQKRHKWLKKAFDEQNFTFPKYYAILVFDGDGMGKWLGGDNLNLDKDQDLKTFHQDFSKQLSLFARRASENLDKSGLGKTVYAGGDDFLAFVSLEKLLHVMADLRKMFAQMVDNPLKKQYRFKIDEMSFSAGVCIAHYKEPLSLVLSRARSVEKKAKDWRDVKNAYGIAVIKGSGESHEMIWGFENWSLDALKYLVDRLRDGTVSNTFIKSFQIEWQNALDIKGAISGMDLMLKKELERLIGRSLNPNLSKNEKKQVKETLIKQLWDGLFAMQDAKLDNFFATLNICDFLHRTLNPLKRSNTPQLVENAND